MNRTAIPFPAIVLCCCLALYLAACGQRGPLYLPDAEDQTSGTETIIESEEGEEKDAEENDEETPRT